MRKYAVIGLSMLITAAFWANSFWSSQEVSYYTDTVVMTVGDRKVNVSEVMIYFLLWRDRIESKWGTSMWSAKTGTDESGQPVTYEDDIKDDIAEEISADKCLQQEAKEQGITLTKKEKTDCQVRAEETIDQFSDDEILQYGITIDKLTKYYEERELAVKFCSDSMREVEEEYDRDDYTMTTVQVLLFPVTEQDSEGNTAEISEKQKTSVKKRAEKALRQIQGGMTMDEAAKEYDLEYNEQESIRLTDEEYADSQWYQVAELEDGEVSGLLEMKYGYLIVQMVHRDDEEKTDSEWQMVVDKAKDDRLIEIYQDQYADDYWIRMEKEIWDVLPLASGDE